MCAHGSFTYTYHLWVACAAISPIEEVANAMNGILLTVGHVDLEYNRRKGI